MDGEYWQDCQWLVPSRFASVVPRVKATVGAMSWGPRRWADLADLILSSPSSPLDSVLAPSDALDRESENDSRFVLGVENAWEVGRNRSTFGLSLHL